jgi:predicted DNA-binding antitoxin AbrB/MazE fold protein
MATIHAIYENGVFRPTEPVDLPQQTKVQLQVHVLPQSPKTEHLDEIYDILSQSYPTGISDLAARHNEHQP